MNTYICKTLISYKNMLLSVTININVKSIIESVMVSTPEGLTKNIPKAVGMSVTQKKPI